MIEIVKEFFTWALILVWTAWLIWVSTGFADYDHYRFTGKRNKNFNPRFFKTNRVRFCLIWIMAVIAWCIGVDWLDMKGLIFY